MEQQTIQIGRFENSPIPFPNAGLYHKTEFATCILIIPKIYMKI